MFRAYAKRADGTYEYSDIVTTTVFKVADVVYRGKKMYDQKSHDYLYDNILKRINPNYEKVSYDFTGSVYPVYVD